MRRTDDAAPAPLPALSSTSAAGGRTPAGGWRALPGCNPAAAAAATSATVAARAPGGTTVTINRTPTTPWRPAPATAKRPSWTSLH